jgi:hypothetical protein
MSGPRPRDPAQRFWEKVDTSGPCWEWIGTRKPDGYGDFWLHGPRLAHRVAWESLVGPIPDGFQLDHLCRNRSCVNPAHLEVVTPRENYLRQPEHIGTRQAAKTHCPAGHPYDATNTYRYPDTGHRRCRTCHREHERERRTS